MRQFHSAAFILNFLLVFTAAHLYRQQEEFLPEEEPRPPRIYPSLYRTAGKNTLHAEDLPYEAADEGEYGDDEEYSEDIADDDDGDVDDDEEVHNLLRADKRAFNHPDDYIEMLKRALQRRVIRCTCSNRKNGRRRKGKNGKGRKKGRKTKSSPRDKQQKGTGAVSAYGKSKTYQLPHQFVALAQIKPMFAQVPKTVPQQNPGLRLRVGGQQRVITNVEKITTSTTSTTVPTTTKKPRNDQHNSVNGQELYGHSSRFPWQRLPNRMCFRQKCDHDEECCAKWNICDRSAKICRDCWYGATCFTEADCCVRFPYCNKGGSTAVGKCTGLP